MVAKVEEAKGNVGLNAATGAIEDLMAAGITDPAKVTRAALQNAGSIAALVLTTEALVADKPEEGGGGRHARHGWHGRHGRHDVGRAGGRDLRKRDQLRTMTGKQFGWACDLELRSDVAAMTED